MRAKPYVVPDLLRESALNRPNRIAVKHKQRAVTFGELWSESSRMKTLLLDLGMRKGDRVGILLDKSIEQLIAMFGISMAGGIFVFINPILKKKQVEHILSDSGASFLITATKYHKNKDIALAVRTLYMDDSPVDESLLSWARLREEVEADGNCVERIADDTACLIYTSGSTGLPKGVVVPHRTVVEGAEIVSSYLGITGDDKLISLLPFNFDYGLNQATSSILHGATLVLHKFFLPGDLFQVLKQEKITGFAGMNPIWVKIFNEKYVSRPDYDFPNLRYITNTGGKVPRSIVRKLQEFFPKTRIFLMYGLTEAFRSTYLPPEELEKRPDSMGKAIPNVEILVVNAKGEECAPGEPGELVHRGALITKGYWNDPEKTRKVFRKNPLLGAQAHLNEIVVYSGDEVKKDEEGFLYFVSRKDQLIKTSGYRVSPTEVEEVLIEIPGVNDAVVFGKEMENGDQIIVAVLETSDPSINADSALKECRKRLPGYMVPQEFYFEKAFMKTANGKIDRSSIIQKWRNSQ